MCSKLLHTTPSVDCLHGGKQLILRVLLPIGTFFQVRENVMKRVIRLLLAIPFFLVRAVVVEEFVRDDALPSHLEEHSTIKKVILRVKATHQVIQVRFVRQDRVCQLLVLLLRSFLPGDVFGGDHVALEEGYGSSLSRHESGLV